MSINDAEKLLNALNQIKELVSEVDETDNEDLKRSKKRISEKMKNLISKSTNNLNGLDISLKLSKKFATETIDKLKEIETDPLKTTAAEMNFILFTGIDFFGSIIITVLSNIDKEQREEAYNKFKAKALSGLETMLEGNKERLLNYGCE